ncbi:Uncharacterized protein GBIM_02214 [Gryllus bimaculatus]|nr:Uncharacterized protein GBIM_02214 [Gryllus bimaculatus]
MRFSSGTTYFPSWYSALRRKRNSLARLLFADTELAILDVWGGVSVLNAENLTMRELVRNTTMRQFNADAFSVSGDQTYVLLESSEKTKMARSQANFLALLLLLDENKAKKGENLITLSGQDRLR